jgi:uncharacterized protein YecE (DUF72 family)
VGRLWIGTSGYAYPHWKQLFYQGVSAPKWLERYAEVFSTVELNTTFYRLPTPAAVDGWRERSPLGFLFACKGSRFLTHMKRLLDPGPGIDRYFEVIGRLGKKLGPVLWQLPPQMVTADPGRLDAFLGLLPKRIRHAVEFRSEGWYTREVCAVLDRHRAAFCEHDLVARRPPSFTGGFRYLRFHGATGKYQGRYGRSGLRPLARQLARWREQGEVFAYFNNDLHGHALLDAMDLSELVGQRREGRSPQESPAPR